MWRLTGNLETAESELRADYETLERAGEQPWRSTTAGLLAHVLCDRSATGEALSLTEEAERIAGEDDYFAQVLWRSARARAIADRDPQAALALARDAVTRAAEAEDPVRHGDALLSLAEVLEAAGRWQEALGATQEAIAVFEAKGATACVQQGEERRQKLLAKQRTGDSEPDSGNSALRKNSR
jgi:tetratricopeptide (TPR) repeat protein